MIDLQKLKHEWKTFALAVVTTAGGIYETIAPSGYDLSVYVPEKYRPMVVPAIGVSFLLLRRYKPEPEKVDVVDTK